LPDAVVAALENRARYAGKRFDLAGDELSGRVVAILSKVTGRPLSYFQVPMAMIRARWARKVSNVRSGRDDG